MTIVLVEVFIAWCYNQFLVTPDLVMIGSGGQLDAEQAERLLRLSERFQWVSYLVVMPSVVVRVALAALVLQMAVMFSESLPVSYGIVFRASVIAHLAKVAEFVVGAFWFMHLEGADRSAALLAGNPLSLTVFVDRGGPLSAYKMIADNLSIGNAVWIVVVAWVLAAELGRPRRSLMITSLIAWGAMVVGRFALLQTLAALTS